MWDHLALLGPRRWSAHPRLERVCSLSVCQLFRLSRFVPDFNVSGKTAEPKMAFNFAHLLYAACGGAARRLRALRARFFSLFLSFSQCNFTEKLGALGVQSSTAHPGPGSSEAHPAGRMIGIGLRAREP